jgi:hypothetical protein
VSKRSKLRRLREKRAKRRANRRERAFKHVQECGPDPRSLLKNWGNDGNGGRWSIHRCSSCGLSFKKLADGRVRIRGLGVFTPPIDAIQLLAAVGGLP